MGRRRKSKKADASRARSLELRLRHVEIARGHDGVLRGAPEPVLLFAVYRATADEITLIARRVVRMGSIGASPERIEIEYGEIETRIPRVDGMRVLVLAAALEADDDRGVERVYAGLEAPGQLAAWSVDARVPDPLTLIEWARTSPPRAPATVRVHLVDAAGDLRDRALGDDWVGAALFHLDDARHDRAEHRMRFASADGRNDWTAVVDVRFV